MTVPPEFSRLFALADIGAVPRTVTIAADVQEANAIARRFGFVSLESLSAEAALSAVERGIEAQGRVAARLTQSCVATAQPISVTVDEAFRVRFESTDAVPAAEEHELNAEDCDVMEHDGLAIDLGEAVAQTLGLAVDPFPRADNADDVLKAAGVLGEAESGPFAALKGLFGKPEA